MKAEEQHFLTTQTIKKIHECHSLLFLSLHYNTISQENTGISIKGRVSNLPHQKLGQYFQHGK